MRFPGIIPAVVVPFTDDDQIDVAALRDNVAFLLDHEVDGVVVNGTMGEAGSLTMEERAVVLDAVVQQVDGRIPVVAGVSAGTTRVATEHARAAKSGGADGVMCLPPLNYRGTPEEIVAFYAAVADAAQVPVMAYNNPEASGIDMPPALIAQIAAEVDGVVAIKECSGDARRIPALIAATDLEVLVGGDDWALEGFATGASGWVTGVGNIAPAECVELMKHVQAGRLAEAREIYQRILPLARLDMTPWLVQYFKGAMDAVGLRGGPSRAPRLPLGPEHQQLLREAVDALGVPAVA